MPLSPSFVVAWKCAGKNLKITFKGCLSDDLPATKLFSKADLDRLSTPSPGGLRFDSALWALQEKMGILLFWGEECRSDTLFLPCESRNSMRFDDGLMSPNPWKDLHFSTFGVVDSPRLPKHFWMQLDADLCQRGDG